MAGMEAKSMEMVGAIRRRDYGNRRKLFRVSDTVFSEMRKKSTRKVPICISTNPSDVNPLELRELYTACNHSCHRFPKLDPSNGKVVVEAIDLYKLGIALSNSSVVVSVFCNLKLGGEEEDALVIDEECGSPVMELLRRLSPFPLLSPSNSQLVGFGRAVSDSGLTASIYDVMVIPSLRRMGIGKMIVKKIIRILTNTDIYDIAALCSPEERLFFRACGFGEDILGSTTMMYARTPSTCPGQEGGDQLVNCAGRKRLLVPPLRKPFQPPK